MPISKVMQKSMVKRRMQKPFALNITSLVDIMTIILVFLLMNYSTEDIQVKPSDELRLPTSTSIKPPQVAVNLIVSKMKILVDGLPVVNLANQEVPDEFKRGTLIIPLYEKLMEKAEQAKKIATISKSKDAGFKGRLLIQMDKDLPFSLLREVMYTAGQAQFGEFKFVVFMQGG